MKKTKRKAVINLIIFFLLLAGGIYMAIAGGRQWYSQGLCCTASVYR